MQRPNLDISADRVWKLIWGKFRISESSLPTQHQTFNYLQVYRLAPEEGGKPALLRGACT